MTVLGPDNAPTQCMTHSFGWGDVTCTRYVYFCNYEIWKSGNKEEHHLKGRRQFACLAVIWNIGMPRGEKKPITLDSRKHSMGVLKWCSKILTQLSWLVKQHCSVFRKHAAPPGFQEGLERWAVVLDPDWFLVLQSASNASPMKNAAEALQWLCQG